MSKSRCIREELARTMTYHCAPTLLGIKPASLVSCRTPEDCAHANEIENLNRQLNDSGLFFTRLCNCTKRHLLFVYRHNLLNAHLQTPRIRQFLQREGYPVDLGLEQIILHLKSRISQCNDFPHEIGIFLGYPLEDVMGFIEHKGKNYRFCGHWKVYGNENHAMSLFERYNRCRDMLCKKLEQGLSFFELLATA
jgi:hypothetical protein